MAYKTFVNRAALNRTSFLAGLHSAMVDMQWQLIDGSDVRVTVPYTNVSIADNTFTSAGHGFVNEMPVYFYTTGALPGGLAVNTPYYVFGATADTFSVSDVPSGITALNITTQGTGTHTVDGRFGVYSSNGESADRIAEYIHFQPKNATEVSFTPCYHWAVGTHTGAGKVYTSGAITTNDTGFYFWIYGNKNLVYIVTKCVSTYTKAFFGHLKPFLPLKTILTESVATGLNATLVVENTSGFEVGYSYQIVGAANEGRDELVVASIVNATTLTVSSLPRNYSAGAHLGLNPSTFGCQSPASLNFCVTCPRGAVGLNSPTNYSYSSLSPMLASTYLDPDVKSNKFILQPVVFHSENVESATVRGLGAYMDEYIFICPIPGLFIEDTFSVTKLISGTSSGNNSVTVFNDTSKTWVTNEFANKVIMITFGTGQGLIKKIGSNTGTALTLADGWSFEALADAASQYIICEEGYRYISDSSTSLGNYALREGV
jgi:hypothetical protein